MCKVKKSAAILELMLLILQLGCSGGGGSAQTETQNGRTAVISGVAQAGPIQGEIHVYTLNSVGELYKIIARTKSDERGKFMVTVPESKEPYALKITSGKYIDESTKVEFYGGPDDALTAVVLGAEGNVSVAITPFSEMVFRRLLARMKEQGTHELGEDLPSAVKNVAEIFKTSADAITTPPAPPSEAGDETAAKRAAKALVKLSQDMKNAGMVPNKGNPFTYFSKIAEEVAKRPSSGGDTSAAVFARVKARTDGESDGDNTSAGSSGGSGPVANNGSGGSSSTSEGVSSSTLPGNNDGWGYGNTSSDDCGSCQSFRFTCDTGTVGIGVNTPQPVTFEKCTQAGMAWTRRWDPETGSLEETNQKVVGSCGTPYAARSCKEYREISNINGLAVTPIPLPEGTVCPEEKLDKCVQEEVKQHFAMGGFNWRDYLDPDNPPDDDDFNDNGRPSQRCRSGGQNEQKLIDDIARNLGIDPITLGRAIHEYKNATGKKNLTRQEIEDVGKGVKNGEYNLDDKTCKFEVPREVGVYGTVTGVIIFTGGVLYKCIEGAAWIGGGVVNGACSVIMPPVIVHPYPDGA